MVADTIKMALTELADGEMLEYREPFFGGGSVGLRYLVKTPTLPSIWINDKDVGIACLWTAVINHHNDSKSRVCEYVPDVADFDRYNDDLRAALRMPAQQNEIADIGFKKLAIHQISYSGLGTMSGGPLGGIEQQSKYKIDCRWSPDYICKRVDDLHEAFSTVEVRHGGCTNLDFADLFLDNSHSSILYLDPPYFHRGGDLYQCGFQEEHARLATALRKTRHSWLLSYNDCPEVRDLYSWAYCHPLDVNYSITAVKDKETGKRTSRTKPEVLICSKQLEGVGLGENRIAPADACCAGDGTHRVRPNWTAEAGSISV